MPKYNLNALGHEEFERLCQSLVQQVIGQGARVYGTGKDGAREATFQGKAPYPSKEEQWDGNWIFQAKFHDTMLLGPKAAQRQLVADLDDELSKITRKYRHRCDNYILMSNVSLTPVFQKGIKDRIDSEIAPKYRHKIKHIHVWGAEEICRFLDAYPNIRRSYAHLLVAGDAISRLLGLVEGKKTKLDDIIKMYCQGCFIHEQSAVLDDAGDVEDEKIELERVFIDLDVKTHPISHELGVMEKIPNWLRQAVQDEDRKSALSYVFDDSISDLVIIGGPGEGKSTLCQYVSQIHRARILGKIAEIERSSKELEQCGFRIPFRIFLREYAQWIASRNNSDSLFNYLAVHVTRESGIKTMSDEILQIIKNSAVLLIIDGLDEVPEKILRQRVLDNIRAFVKQTRDVLKGNLRVIATTRPRGYSEEFDPNHNLHLVLMKLSPEKAVSYAGMWIEAREPNPTEAKRIFDTFSVCLKDRVVNVLSQTPLQVTVLLVIVRARGTPPKQREELFERYMDIIYQREQKRRPELLRTQQDMIYGLHKYLAYLLHKKAESDETAALMGMSEFREKVEEYVNHCNPLLKPRELETEVDQIITEARTRLVLIESPQEGKVGFGLTTIREFFAAAHLVDTAKDTSERDLRFRAISKSLYWRNVALFFAGRVGRTRPGEAASMIDMSRQIDTEGVDKILKRGAELVVEMVDDRVLRQPHNEIGAIQYGLQVIDRGFIENLTTLSTH
jgi:nucleoside-triphosphatase THEP1